MHAVFRIALGMGAALVALAFAQLSFAQATAPTVVNSVSRKVHGAAGTFDLPLATNTLDPTTEPRIGPNHTIVFVFSKPVIAGSATVTEGSATAGAATFAGNQMIVPLMAVGNQQYVTVAVNNVVAADGGNNGSGSIRIGFLAGDVNQNRAVSLSDLLQLNAHLTFAVKPSNYLLDMNASGTFTLADMLAINAQLTAALPQPQNPAWNGTCPGFANTRVLTLDWANPVRLYTTSVGIFTSNDALVVKFTTGNVSSGASLPRIEAAEYQTSPSTRIGVLSSTPCDFSTQPAAGANLQGNSITLVFAVGTGSGYGYYPVLQTNTTYYLNIKNAPNPTCATVNDACDMFVDLLKPSGM